ncbi:MAG: hypothetical protein QGI60_01470 [archaeon]|jgi:hypothetical protein|nr:hypothetical protein [archaeon]
MVDARKMTNDLMHIGVLLALLGVLLGLLTWTGVMQCNAIPGWCDVYWGILGKPSVLIVYGDSGLGNPVGACTDEGCSLQEMLANPKLLGVHAQTLHIDRVNSGNLTPYNLVIVERARKIPTKTLRAFIDYYNSGGRLIWTGDAGTELGESYVGGKLVKDEYLHAIDRTSSEVNKLLENTQGEDTVLDFNVPIGPWARKDGDLMISFDQLLSLNYAGNYCQFNTCFADKPIHVGNIEPEPSRDHPLIRGIAADLQLWVFKDQDFAVVQTIPGGITTEVLTLDMGSNLIVTNPKNNNKADYGKTNPMIVTSGVGGRVIYYSMPPELYANPRLDSFDKDLYYLPLENMYYGSLYG